MHLWWYPPNIRVGRRCQNNKYFLFVSIYLTSQIEKIIYNAINVSFVDVWSVSMMLVMIQVLFIALTLLLWENLLYSSPSSSMLCSNRHAYFWNSVWFWPMIFPLSPSPQHTETSAPLFHFFLILSMRFLPLNFPIQLCI